MGLCGRRVNADLSAVCQVPACVQPWPGLAWPREPEARALPWPRLTNTVDLPLLRQPASCLRAFGALGNVYPLPNSWRADLTLFISWNKTQPRGGWALGRGRCLSQVPSAHLELIPAGRGADRKRGDTSQRCVCLHRDGEGQRQDRSHTAVGRETPGRC